MIVVGGEALIDLVPLAQPPGALLPRPGGGPYNTALALGRLGAEVAFCSRVSTDGLGESLLSGLRAAGVDLSLVQRGPEPTTLAVPSLAPDGSAAYGFYVEGTADRLFTLPPALPDGVRALALGTCSLLLEPGASAYEALLRRESQRGLLTLLDPNIRPALIADPALYRARFLGWLPYVSVLKLSEEDAAWLGGRVSDWLAAGPSAVVLTRGAGGLTVWTREGAEHSAPSHRISVVDTIGAGDTVNAALLHRLSGMAGQPVDWPGVLAYAAHAAALTCTRAGAEPPYAAELSG
ncbi:MULTISPECIES: carbohydrate kinase [unclassified Streptomyces]|uniref:carbohydrate kinase family protein n=1 Tax=unclassified Streptomyces TaxID=2593676 RepID=UPI001BEB2BCC|nr:MULTISPECIES: carbohydrate kinase [unclassified Streptomyces]MBT2402270.1 carbohydrate kinase [Streptomyces sp. ISL-21]MBT2606783.1 carbohydrate kinase [Streptomyces sp. ISL-87]